MVIVAKVQRLELTLDTDAPLRCAVVHQYWSARLRLLLLVGWPLF